MTAVLLGLAAALAYGIGDFLGGLLSRRMHYRLVAVAATAVAFAVSVIALVLSGPGEPTSGALLWGAVSGVGSGLGTLALFRGLGRGRMGIVAPLSALGAAALPVVIGLALGERPSPIAWAGVALALPAIWLVSTSGSGPGNGSVAAGVVDGLLAGVGFALLFVALSFAGDSSGLWPVAASQGGALMVVSVVTLGTLRTLDRRGVGFREKAGAVSIGIIGAAASLFYFWSTHEGLLSIVAVITSLYPAVTVLLAAGLLREAITRRQTLGLAFAAAAVLLIVLG